MGLAIKLVGQSCSTNPGAGISRIWNRDPGARVAAGITPQGWPGTAARSRLAPPCKATGFHPLLVPPLSPTIPVGKLQQVPAPALMFPDEGTQSVLPQEAGVPWAAAHREAQLEPLYPLESSRELSTAPEHPSHGPSTPTAACGQLCPVPAVETHSTGRPVTREELELLLAASVCLVELLPACRGWEKHTFAWQNPSASPCHY